MTTGNKLSHLEVLLLDAQTTGSSPKKGHLLELAWARTTAARSSQQETTVHSRIVALPKKAQLPRRITKLTGITKKDLLEAVDPERLWAELRESIDALNVSRPVPTVVHYARFERPFLQDLHGRYGGGGEFPLDFICTHLIASTLLPDLPRRGLRALAGYFGHVMGELKRAKAHVSATALVWSELVHTLEERLGITELDELIQWLDESKAKCRPKTRGRRAYPISRELRLGLPDAPGVYKMLALGGEVLYVGKATSLSRRVNSYFQKRRHARAERMLELLTQVRDVEVRVTSSALEAALLESDEIKRISPPYNRALRGASSDVWFATHSAMSSRRHPNEEYSLGPLPSPTTLHGLGALRATLSRLEEEGSHPIAEDTLPLLLGLPEDVHLNIEETVLRESLRSFRARYAIPTGGPTTLAPLLRAGAQIWRTHRARSQTDDDSSQSHEAEPAAEEAPDWHARSWDVDRVLAALESVVEREAHLLRRAHLLCRLTQSAVVFRPKSADSEERRMLVFDEGAISESRSGPAGMALPLPPDWKKNPHERRAAFDVASYDRLRILLTELRRLVAEQRQVSLRLDPHPAFENNALERWLSWV